MSFEIILKWFYDHNTLILVFFILSFVLAVLLFVALVRTINNLPADFFLQEKKSSQTLFPLRAKALNKDASKYPDLAQNVVDPPTDTINLILSIIKLILKNILGILLLIFGIIMLFLPGQGILTIFISLLLIDFPGKWKLINYLSHKKKIVEAMNLIRRRFKKSDLISPKD